MIKKVKGTVLWTYGISHLKEIEEIAGTFCENELQETNQKEFKIEKLTNRKGGKLSVK